MKKGIKVERIMVEEEVGIIEEETHIVEILNPMKVMTKKKNQMFKKLITTLEIGKRIIIKKDEEIRDMIHPINSFECEKCGYYVSERKLRKPITRKKNMLRYPRR